jgi:molybdenum cofactor cytidylyltransferase
MPFRVASRTAGIVLAAGESSRMGREKQLLTVGGETLLGRVLDACLASGLDEVVLVLGHEARRIRASLERFQGHPRLSIVVNPRHGEGMSTSLIAGLRAVEESCDRVMILLGDMPCVTPDVIDRLRLASAASGCSLAAVTVRGRRAHPVVIGREHFEAVRSLADDRGARDLFRDHPDDLCLVDAGERYEPLDIDTPEEFERFRRSEARRSARNEAGSPDGREREA